MRDEVPFHMGFDSVMLNKFGIQNKLIQNCNFVFLGLQEISWIIVNKLKQRINLKNQM